MDEQYWNLTKLTNLPKLIKSSENDFCGLEKKIGVGSKIFVLVGQLETQVFLFLAFAGHYPSKVFMGKQITLEYWNICH